MQHVYVSHDMSLTGLSYCHVMLLYMTGLSLTFNVDQDDYIGDMADGAGLRVVVHDQSQMPFPEYSGIAVNPGQLTYIGASMVC